MYSAVDLLASKDFILKWTGSVRDVVRLTQYVTDL